MVGSVLPTSVFLFQVNSFGLPRRSLLSARLPWWFRGKAPVARFGPGKRKSGLIQQTDGSGRTVQGIFQTRDIREEIKVGSSSVVHDGLITASEWVSPRSGGIGQVDQPEFVHRGLPGEEPPQIDRELPGDGHNRLLAGALALRPQSPNTGIPFFSPW